MGEKNADYVNYCLTKVDRLKRKRKEMGISQGAMKDKLKISRQHLSEIENGKSVPSASLLHQYATEVGLVEILVEKECFPAK